MFLTRFPSKILRWCSILHLFSMFASFLATASCEQQQSSKAAMATDPISLFRFPNRYKAKSPAVLIACLMFSACDALPRDPSGTAERVEHRKVFAVGAVDPSARTAPEVLRLIGEIEQRTHAHARWEPGSGEALLQRLDDGTLDLAVGNFRQSSPWESDIAFAPPLSSSGSKDAPMEMKAAMRNGENRWIMTVERASRAVSAKARAQ